MPTDDNDSTPEGLEDREREEGAETGVPGVRDTAQLELEVDEAGNALIYFVDFANEAAFMEPKRLVKKSALLAKFHANPDVLETFPLRPYKTEHDFLQPKHPGLKSIVFEGFGLGFPNSAGEAADILDGLPAGFVKGYQFGLGMHKKNLAIVHAATDVPNVETLVIRRGDISAPRVEGSTFILPADFFDGMRRALERITVHYRTEAASDKRDLVHNQMLQAIDPKMFPETPPRYRRDAVYRVVAATASTGLTAKDQSAAVELVAKCKETIARDQPKKVLRLRSELELVTLSQLIEKFKSRLGQPLSEADWQAFLADNAFVLSMAFGYPVIKIGEQIAVGGTKLSGGGTKFADFAARHASSGNLAIVEIKRPGTDLLSKKEYRGGVYPMSPELAGGVQQLLDQRYQLQRSISLLKDNSGIRDLQAYAVDCVLIAGVLPSRTSEALLKSFELARRSMHGVQVVTFDELLAKLESLQSFLAEGLAEQAPQE
ncbi:MAG: DUF4263 domain-containing protein [Burkholderiales bacterium]|nr:DUF4263 domain-containing protein [Burkholderiales bacterium]